MPAATRSLRESLTLPASLGDSSRKSTTATRSSASAKRPQAWLVLVFWASLFLTFASPIHAQSPPPVKFLGVPTPVFTNGIGFPIQLAMDSSGNIYIADDAASAVFKETLQSDGSFVQSTVASGFPDGAVGVAVDSAGNVYVGLDLSSGTSQLIKETLQGNGSYVASYMGTLASVWGIVVDASNNVYATNNGSADRVTKFTPSGNSYTSATIFTSSSGALAGLALDSSGDLFVTLEYENTIYKLTPSGNPATTTTYTPSTITIGTGDSAFGVAVDTAGDLYVADRNGFVRLETPDGGTSYTEWVLASGLASPYGVLITPAGAIYVSQSGSVDVFSPAAVNLGTKAVKATTSTFALAYTIQSGTVVSAINVVSQGVTNTQSGSPEFVKTSSSTCTAQTYSGLTTCFVDVTFTPQFPGLRTGAVEFLDASGNLLSTAHLYGTGTAPVAAFSPGTASVTSISGLGSTPLSGARGSVVDAAGNLYVADSLNDRIVKVAPGGAATVLATPDFTLSAPTGVAIDGAGNLYIADSGNGRVVRLSPQGVASVMATNSIALSENYGVAVDGLGNVYTSDATNDRVLVFPLVGTPHVLLTTGVTLGSAYGVAADGSGNVFIADESNSRIVKVNGGVGSVLGMGSLPGGLLHPQAVTVDAVGNVYVADSGNNRMVEISAGTTNGVVLSTGSYSLSFPNGAAVGNTGNLYIDDGNNNRIVTVSQESPAPLIFTTPDTTEPVTMLNLGNLALTLSVPSSGYNPGFGTSDFTLLTPNTAGYCPQASTASKTLAAGANCTLSVEFSPPAQSSGTVTDALTVTDNNLGVLASTQSIALSGTSNPTPTVTLTASPASPIAYGQAQTSLGVLVSYTSGTPAGTVSFTDNSISLGSPVTLSGGAGSFPAQYYLPGSQSFLASYSGNGSFNPATSASVSYVVNKAGSTLIPPSLAVQVVQGTNGSIPVTVAGQYSGGGIATPTGSVSYSITNSSNAVVASSTASISSGTVSIPVASTLAAGVYTVSLSYAGDTNYSAATAATGSLRVGTVTPAIGWAQPAQLTYGTSLSGILDATAMNGSTVVAGSFTYTATPTGGGASSVTSATLLSAGSYVLTASFTPTNTAAYGTAVGTVTLTVGKATPALSWPAPAAIAYGTALSASLNAAATFHSSTVPGSFTFAATPAGGSATAVTSTTHLTAGSYTLTASFTPTDTTDYAAGSITAVLTVNKDGSAVELASSVNPVLLSNPTAITAAVSATAGIPTGAVIFLDGTTQIGSASLSNGMATLILSSLTVGSHTLSAIYSGDTNFSTSISGLLTQAVIDFTTSSGGGANGASQTVLPGGAATYSLSIVPNTGVTFPTPAALTITGLPPGATASVTPSSWAQTAGTSWTYPANTPLTNVALTVQLPSATARNDRKRPIMRDIPPMLWGLLLIPFAGRRRWKISGLGKTMSVVLLMVVGCAVAAGVSGCGSSNGFFNQTQQTYTMNVTVTSGSLSRSTKLTLTIE